MDNTANKSTNPALPDRAANPPPDPKRRKMTGANWALLEPIWPATERPETLQDPEYLEKMDIGVLMKLHTAYSAREKQQTGQAIAKASKDSKPPKLSNVGGEDDCDTVFTAGRWLNQVFGTSMSPLNTTQSTGASVSNTPWVWIVRWHLK